MRRSGVLFDFDGTLTKPYLDFDAIRAEIGVEGLVLEAIQAMAPDDRARAEQVVRRHERKAAENATLQDGAIEVVAACRVRGFPVGIVTRNARESVELVLRNHQLQVDALRTREYGAIKPSPQPVLSICEELGVEPDQSWFVGDHLIDLQTGKAAGCRTVLFAHEDTPAEFAEQADFLILRLDALLGIIG